MMETKEQERKWHLIRNDNGEWISDGSIVLVDKEIVGNLNFTRYEKK